MKIKKYDKILISSCVCIYIAFISLLVSMQSDIAPFSKKIAGEDSSVFSTIGFLMTKGLMPYRDSFDHKGPLLYIINWLGIQVSYYRGVWIFELLAIMLTFFIIYKIARFICGIAYSCLTLFIASSLLFVYLDGGNVTEEYAMPFIAISLYYFLDYFLNDKINSFRLILCGISFGCVLLLRANMVSVWICFCFMVLIQLFYEKKFDRLIKFISFFLCGIAIVIVPITIWLITQNAFVDFWNDYIIFNRMYISDATRATLSNKFNSFRFFSTNTLIIFSLIMSGYLCRMKLNYCNAAYLLCMILTLLLICMSGMSYNHYGIILVPLIAYPIANLVAIGNMPSNSSGTTIIAIMLLVNITISPWYNALSNTLENYTNRKIDYEHNLYDLIDLIINYTNEEDKITTWGNWDIIYLLSSRIPASKYSYQFPIAEINEKIFIEYFNDLDYNSPKFIIIKPGRELGLMANYLEQHSEYTYVGNVNGADIYYNGTEDLNTYLSGE